MDSSAPLSFSLASSKNIPGVEMERNIEFLFVYSLIIIIIIITIMRIIIMIYPADELFYGAGDETGLGNALLLF